MHNNCIRVKTTLAIKFCLCVFCVDGDGLGGLSRLLGLALFCLCLTGNKLGHPCQPAASRAYPLSGAGAGGKIVHDAWLCSLARSGPVWLNTTCVFLLVSHLLVWAWPGLARPGCAWWEQCKLKY